MWESSSLADPSVVEDWMVLVVTSSAGYSCGEQCGVVDVSYQTEQVSLFFWEVCGKGEQYVVHSGVSLVGFGTCQTAQPMMPRAPRLGLSFLPQHPHPCLPTLL